VERPHLVRRAAKKPAVPDAGKRSTAEREAIFNRCPEPLISTARQHPEQALASGSPANNPAVPTTDQIQDLYARIYA